MHINYKSIIQYVRRQCILLPIDMHIWDKNYIFVLNVRRLGRNPLSIPKWCKYYNIKFPIVNVNNVSYWNNRTIKDFFFIDNIILLSILVSSIQQYIQYNIFIKYLFISIYIYKPNTIHSLKTQCYISKTTKHLNLKFGIVVLLIL